MLINVPEHNYYLFEGLAVSSLRFIYLTVSGFIGCLIHLVPWLLMAFSLSELEGKSFSCYYQVASKGDEK